jgi:hypothetical protein
LQARLLISLSDKVLNVLNNGTVLNDITKDGTFTEQEVNYFLEMIENIKM